MGSVVSSIANVFTGADDTKAAGNLAAEQQRQAAQGAAFRPVGMTTRFGTSNFTRATDPTTGLPYISEAGYTASPELAALQNRLFGQFGQGLTQAEQTGQQYGALSPASQSLFNLGSQYLAMSPEQAAQDYMSQQQALLQPGREAQFGQLRALNFGQGTSGLGVNTGTGGAPSNPLAQALFNAQSRENLQLAAQADEYGRQRTTYGAGLFGLGSQLLGEQAAGMSNAYSPLQTQLGLSGQVETMAQMPYQLGIQLGTAQQPGQQTGVQALTQAAQTQYGATQAANAANAGFWGGVMQSAAMAAGAPAKSDIRAKENIKLEGKLLSGLNVYSYEYKPEFKDTPTAGHGRFIGVMAQEALDVIPEAVSLDTDGLYMVDYSLIH